MDAISYSALRADLAGTMDRVCDDREPIVVTRKNGRSVVMLSLEDYAELEETAYLLRSPANAKRLSEAIQQLLASNGVISFPGSE
jgi:antitoxin YefM